MPACLSRASRTDGKAEHYRIHTLQVLSRLVLATQPQFEFRLQASMRTNLLIMILSGLALAFVLKYASEGRPGYRGEEWQIALIDGCVFLEYGIYRLPPKERGWGRLEFICLADGGWSCDSYFEYRFVEFWLQNIPLELPCWDVNHRYGYLLVPLWMPVGVLLAAMPLAIRPIHFVKRRARKRRGQCSSCGYDLRGSSLRCPECGDRILGRCTA